MQNILGKLLEKIVPRKLVNDSEVRRMVPQTPEGYSVNKQTWLHTAVFAQDVFERFPPREETMQLQ